LNAELASLLAKVSSFYLLLKWNWLYSDESWFVWCVHRCRRFSTTAISCCSRW
jgi:hypothetical protein